MLTGERRIGSGRVAPHLATVLLAVGVGCGDIDGSATDAAPADARADSFDALVSNADAAPQVGPSCSGLSQTCGPDGNESCCASLPVPGGTYYRSYDQATDDYNDMSYAATVSDFRLDTYEVTVGRFRAFINAGMGTQAQPPVGGSGAHGAIQQSGWDSSWNTSLPADTAALIAALKCDATFQTWTDAPGANEHRPISCITWYMAMAFCIWDGGYLPTEAEWNHAATGGDEQRAYPWSNPPGATAIDDTYAVYENTGPTQNVGTKSPKGNGRWGHADLGGNVWEWTLDRYWPDYLYSNPCADCANLTDGNSRVFRGGSFDRGAGFLRTALRYFNAPTVRFSTIGVRCARAP